MLDPFKYLYTIQHSNNGWMLIFEKTGKTLRSTDITDILPVLAEVHKNKSTFNFFNDEFRHGGDDIKRRPMTDFVTLSDIFVHAPLFVIQNNMVDRVVLPVVEYCKENNIEFIDGSMTSNFDFDTWKPLLEADPRRPKIVYGSVGWTIAASKSKILSKWVFANNEVFTSTYWKKILGEDYLNHDGYVIAVKDLKISEPVHIRPLTEEKSVIGKVYDAETWKEHCKERNVSDELLLWVSPTKRIDAEYRYWYTRNRIMAGVQYRKTGEMFREQIRDPDMFKFPLEIGEQLASDEQFVIDIALVNGEYKMIEINPYNASGWYDIKPSGVIRGITTDAFERKLVN